MTLTAALLSLCLAVLALVLLIECLWGTASYVLIWTGAAA